MTFRGFLVSLGIAGICATISGIFFYFYVRGLRQSGAVTEGVQPIKTASIYSQVIV